tara:strand:+ start:81 stop:419 length:339 start_codon:yes stop_codon:yes gene_type:complete
MNFQKSVIVSACILLIISLSIIGYLLYKNKSEKKYPPVLADCPDYWLSDSSNSQLCYNDYKLGNCLGSVDFSQSKYQGDDGGCEKAKWANGCNVTWTGITSNPNICGTQSTV